MSELSKSVRVARHLAAFSARFASMGLALTSICCGEGSTPTIGVGPGASQAGYAGSVPNGGSAGSGGALANGGASDLGGAGASSLAGSATVEGGASAAGAAGSAGSASSASSAGTENGGTGGMPASCDVAHASGVAQLNLMSGGVARKVRLFVPSTYDGKQKLPLVLNLHGSSDNADNFAASSQMEKTAESEGFAVAGLEALAGQWNVPPADNLPDDVTYASDAINLVAASLCIDLARVYASGFSGGGRMSSRLGCVLPDKIAAIGPVAGVRWPAPCPGRPVPVITIHGLADSTNAYAGEGAPHPRWNESVEDAVLGWATKNGCNLTRQTDDPAGPLSTYSYGQCNEGASVKLIRMDGVEHAYPTGTRSTQPKKSGPS